MNAIEAAALKVGTVVETINNQYGQRGIVMSHKRDMATRTLGGVCIKYDKGVRRVHAYHECTGIVVAK